MRTMASDLPQRGKRTHSMSKHVNMTGHYKIAGRERQGEDILQSSEKGAFAQQRQEARREAIALQAGPPAWETTPQNFDIADTSKTRTKRATKGKRGKARKNRKTANRRSAKRARKAAPKRKAARRQSAVRAARKP